MEGDISLAEPGDWAVPGAYQGYAGKPPHISPFPKCFSVTFSVVGELLKHAVCVYFWFCSVQAEVIPAILQSASNGYLLGRGGYRPKDICVSAPTGSGKTLAFVIPIVQVSLSCGRCFREKCWHCFCSGKT